MLWLSMTVVSMILSVLLYIENVKNYGGRLNKSQTDEEKKLEESDRRDVRTPSIFGATIVDQSLTVTKMSNVYTMHEE